MEVIFLLYRCKSVSWFLNLNLAINTDLVGTSEVNWEKCDVLIILVYYVLVGIDYRFAGHSKTGRYARSMWRSQISYGATTHKITFIVGFIFAFKSSHTWGRPLTLSHARFRSGKPKIHQPIDLVNAFPPSNLLIFSFKYFI